MRKKSFLQEKSDKKIENGEGNSISTKRSAEQNEKKSGKSGEEEASNGRIRIEGYESLLKEQRAQNVTKGEESLETKAVT